jgi:replicative DNA helicase
MNILEANQPPNNLEAEEALLGTCLTEDDTLTFDTISNIVSAEDFFTHRCKLVFSAIQSLANAGKDVDEITIQEELKSQKSLDEAGGLPGILRLADKATTSLKAQEHARVVAEKSNLRRLIRECRIAIESAEGESVEYKQIRSLLESNMLSIDNNATEDYSIGGSLDELSSDVDRMGDDDYVPDVIRTRIGRLDSFLGNGGIAPGEVFTLAAPTSCGKSALSLFIAGKTMKHDGTPTAYFSMEMPQKQLMKRMVQVMSGVNMRAIQDGYASAKDVERFKKNAEEAKALPLYTSHRVKSAEDLIGQTRYLVRKKGVKLVVIDYLQLIPFDAKHGKAAGIADISHKIKQMAIDLNVAVILLAQVNREGAKRGGLELYDLKDSGDIENDADVVLLMWPSQDDVESSKKKDSTGSYTELLYKLAKNREGERDLMCFFKFYHQTGRFA